MINSGVYIAALLCLCIGVPVEFEAAYPMLQTYDPFGLSIIVPVLGVAGLFGGLWVGHSSINDEVRGRVMWGVMIALTLFSLMSFNHKSGEHYGDIGPALFSLIMPAILWGVQTWIWARPKLATEASVPVASDVIAENEAIARKKIADLEVRWTMEGLDAKARAAKYRAMLLKDDTIFDHHGVTVENIMLARRIIKEKANSLDPQ